MSTADMCKKLLVDFQTSIIGKLRPRLTSAGLPHCKIFADHRSKMWGNISEDQDAGVRSIGFGNWRQERRRGRRTQPFRHQIQTEEGIAGQARAVGKGLGVLHLRAWSSRQPKRQKPISRPSRPSSLRTRRRLGAISGEDEEVDINCFGDDCPRNECGEKKQATLQP
ncbi:hypothetical protein JAAARDRAFT_323228 [Jaapia argillacea MUCL 33604]|uniref:Uncharacterized protein n=1 Tax=Jaapia argillacea MUCL 33604 TaxID=933084 RepID=A0A067PKZ1_9AGAM|nr:hypothetical protein JAAARDRAFT_323228 [Jaapia argillacea MUCL 33604]